MATKVVTGVVVYLNHREMFKKQTRTILGLCATLKSKHTIWGKCHLIFGIFP